MAALREPTTAFFDAVLVLSPERAVRERRLMLLRRIRDLLGRVGRVELLRDDLTAPSARESRTP
jgi:glycyl-tRNA synthetase beta subunit